MKEWFTKFVQDWLGMDQLTALILIAAFSFLGQGAWTQGSRLVDRWRYGGWTLIVMNGTSKRNWKAPLDIEIIRHLTKKNYYAFKRDLGTAISGDIILKFTFGVDITEKEVVKKEPQATGMSIDHKTKTITIDCAIANLPISS